jgi:hypothetical protein
MFKDIAIKMSVVACVLIMMPAFADDSDLYPEPVPVDQQPLRGKIESHTQSDDQQPTNNQDSPQLTAREESIIGQDQAQFEEEQNTLQPGRANESYFQNKEHDERVLKQDRERLENDIQTHDHYNAEVDRLKIKEDEQTLMQDRAEAREEHRKIVNDENLQPGPRQQAQQNIQKFQQQQPNRSDGADW